MTPSTPDPRASRGRWQGAERYRVIAEADMIAHLRVLGWSRLARGDAASLAAEIAAHLDHAVKGGLPCRESAGGRWFDPVETVNYFKWAGLAGLSPVWRDVLIPNALAIATQGMAGRGCTVELTRRFNLARVPRERRARLRLPVPMAYRGLRLAHVDLRANTLQGVKMAGGGCWIEAMIEPGRVDEVALTASFNLEPAADRQSADDGANPCYLAEHEGLATITPRIANLARALAAGATDDRQRADRLFSYLLNHLSLGLLHYDLRDRDSSVPEWVLEQGWFDCQSGSALLIAMCRSLKIPARLLSGYFLNAGSPTVHYWAEVWCGADGWRSYDPIVWDLSAAGQDRSWRDAPAGTLDPRLVVSCMPLRFPGPVGVPVPDDWIINVHAERQGVTTRLSCVGTGDLVYADHLRVLPPRANQVMS